MKLINEKKPRRKRNQVVTGCSKFAQKEYKKRYNTLGMILYWKSGIFPSSFLQPANGGKNSILN